MNKDRYADALIAIRDYGWEFKRDYSRPILLPPENDKRRFWCAMWDEDGFPHWLPKYSQGEE